MKYRLLRDYLKKLLEISLELDKLSKSDNISYDKAVELRQKHQEAYNKWLFYKNLASTIGNAKQR